MMQPWFEDAKLGIFIHWGIYAVNGTWESWEFFCERRSYDDYMKQLDGFTAKNYDPRAWAELFRKAGAQYAVLTSKHHDGVALWPTEQSELSVAKKTPAGRDLIGPYCEALREQGLRVGLYFSHLDWSHPDYSSLPVEQRTSKNIQIGNPWPIAPDSEQWQRFLKFHRAQLQELSTRYAPDLLWFDGDWEQGNEYWRMDELREQLHRWNPQGVILNSRMKGYGDYETPEQGVPILRPEGIWEFCVTVNDSWGYQNHDHNHKSPRQIVRMFCETIGMGGRLLLDIGPREDGTILPEQMERLEALGDWIRKHEEAVLPTTEGLPCGHFYGASTLSKDRRNLYLMFFDRPWDEIAVKGIRSTVKRVSVVGSGAELSHRRVGGAEWEENPGVLWINVPENELDPLTTVVKVELENELDLYRGAGRVVDKH
jgi:alpha-L-fucosidase